MTYVLYNRSGSGGFAVEAAMALAGVPCRVEHLHSLPNEPLRDKIGHLNDWGQVPVLQLPDGSVMTELAAIMSHLTAEETGFRDGPHLWVDDQATFLRWSVFLCVNVYEGILRQTYPQRFCGLSGIAGEPQETGSDAWLLANISQAADERTHAALVSLDQATNQHEFLLGNQMSACDVILAMLYAWHNQRPDLKRFTWITSQVATHPIVRPVWKAHFDTRLGVKWHEL